MYIQEGQVSHDQSCTSKKISEGSRRKLYYLTIHCFAVCMYVFTRIESSRISSAEAEGSVSHHILLMNILYSCNKVNFFRSLLRNFMCCKDYRVHSFIKVLNCVTEKIFG